MNKVTGILCPECKDTVWSRHRHDFRACPCKAVFVDGGRDYIRGGALKDGVALPEPVEIEINEDDPDYRYSFPLK